MAIFFYSRTDQYGEFSNFSHHGIQMDGEWWPTTEHYFQAQKFNNPAYQRKIRNAPTPMNAANLGRSREFPIRTDWNEVKDGVMLDAVRQKFRTHKALRALLLDTGDELIVENAPGDYYWGIGRDQTGQNKLGLILMQVREELRSRSQETAR